MSSDAICPAISTGWSVDALSAAGPRRTRSVTRAIVRSGKIAGWKNRSWKTETTSKPAASARRPSRSYSSTVVLD
jgi:hypothetical protein